MKIYKINKTFATFQECEAWENENCPDRRYQGKAIIMIYHTNQCGGGSTTLTEIWTV